MAKSATVRSITMLVEQSHLRLEFDASDPMPIARIGFAMTGSTLKGFLFLQTDVFPVVERISGCDVISDAPANQLLPHDGDLSVPLICKE